MKPDPGIVVLEGPMGSGKTTIGSALASSMGVPLYRPFRTDRELHRPDPLIARLMPANTWREDIMVADALAVLKPSCVLDRSLPSGLVYSDMPDDSAPSKALADWWAERMATCGAAVVFLNRPERDRAAANAWRRPAFDDEHSRIFAILNGIHERTALRRRMFVLDVDSGFQPPERARSAEWFWLRLRTWT